MSHIEEGTLHAYIDGELGEHERRDVDRHTAACPECHARLEEAMLVSRRASDLLAELEPGSVRAPAWRALEQRAAARTKERPGRYWLRPAAAWAASLFLAFGIGWLSRSYWGQPAGTPTLVSDAGRRAPRTPDRVEAPETAPASDLGPLRVSASEATKQSRPAAHRTEAHSRPAGPSAEPKGPGSPSEAEISETAIAEVGTSAPTEARAVSSTIAEARTSEAPAEPKGPSSPSEAEISETAIAEATTSTPPVEPRGSSVPTEAEAEKTRMAEATTSALVAEARVSAPPPETESGDAPSRLAELEASASEPGPPETPRQPDREDSFDFGSVRSFGPRRPAERRARVGKQSGPEQVLAAQPEQAAYWLGGELRTLPELRLQRVEVVPGSVMPEGIAGRAAVRMVYTDAAGQEITLLQQLLGDRAEEGVEAEPVLVVEPNGRRTYRWRDGKGYLLMLQGEVSSDALRALSERVR